MKKNNINPTAEIGLVVVTAVILGLISTYLPIIGTAIDFFWSLPFAVLSARLGIRKAAFALMATIIVLSLLIGSVLTIRLALSFGFAGLAIGFAIQKQFSAVKIFMLTLAVSFTSQVVSTALLFFVMDINFMEIQLAAVRESFLQSFELYESLGVEPAQIEQSKAQVEPTMALMSLLMPTLLLLIALINTVICFYTVKWIFSKMGIIIADFPEFSTWRFPIEFFYLMVLALLGLYWGSTRNLNILYTVSVNANILAVFVGFIQGLSILSFAANKFNMSKLVRRLIFVVIILNFMLFQVVAFTGLFDMLFDYRSKFSDRK